MKAFITKLLYTLLPMGLVLITDQVTKSWARTLESPEIFGPFKFDLVFNYGIMLGHLSDLPQTIKEVSFLTLGTIIFAVYFCALWLIPIRSRATYLGLSLVVGGIIGNVCDRFYGSAVTDFLTLNLDGKLPYLNLADIYQWFGYAGISIGLYRDYLYYWPKEDWRNKFIINLRFQLRMSFMVSGLTFFSGTIILMFSYAFIKGSENSGLTDHFFAFGFLVIGILSLMTFVSCLVVSHRIAGPVYAIEKHLKLLRKGDIQKFRLREFDEFKEIEKEMNALTEEIDVITAWQKIEDKKDAA